MSRVVTGDAVVLGLQPARVPSRGMAIAVDLAIVLTVYLLLSVGLLSAVMPLGTATAAAVRVALLVLVLVGGPIAVETLSRGRSLGKLLFGLRVVRGDGGPIGFRHALVRGVVGFVEIYVTAGAAAIIASLVSAEGRRLGDIFGGTLVVRERLPGGRAASGVAMPVPQAVLAGQFAQLDLSRVPDGLWLAVRQYLTRVGQLDRQVAWSMAVRLATDVMERVGAPAPPGMPPGEYLNGVAAERQRREAERAFETPPAPERAAPVRQPMPPMAPPQRPMEQSPGHQERYREPERKNGFTPPA